MENNKARAAKDQAKAKAEQKRIVEILAEGVQNAERVSTNYDQAKASEQFRRDIAAGKYFGPDAMPTNRFSNQGPIHLKRGVPTSMLQYSNVGLMAKLKNPHNQLLHKTFKANFP